MKDLLTNPAVLEPMLEVLAALLAALTSLGIAALVKWLRGHGIVVNEAETRQVEIIAKQAAAYAEEWGRALAKGGDTPSGGEKAAVASRAFKELATGRLAKMAGQRADVAIQAALPALRAQSIPPLAAIESENPHDPRNGL